jgi:signal transduction histidine kinase
LRRAPIRIRTFIFGTVLVLLLVPTLAAGAAWVIEGARQQTDIRQRLNTAVGYLTSHGTEMREPAAVQGFVRLLGRLDLLAEVALITRSPPGKHPVYSSPVLEQVKGPPPRRLRGAGKPPATPTIAPAPASWIHDRQRLLPAGTRNAPAILVTDLYHRPASRTTQALVALVTGVLVLLAGLAVAAWLAGRWMVAPLTTLSAQVDKVAGGDLAIAVPRSRIDEIANIAQAVDGMTAALGETAQRRTEADEARRFLVTGIAHDLRTPLFALRGHLQAIGSGVGDPSVHLERAEARADALERLTGNLFAYTRDDYTQPALQLEAVPVADLLDEVTAGLEHTAHLRGNTFALDGDGSLAVVVDRDRAKRALANILDNAIRYSPTGAPVDLSWASVDESSVGITIRDHGPGFDPDLLPRIFEPGVRGAPADGGADGGAGLGLTIAKRLLEQQHATLTVRNQPAGGAETSVKLQRVPSTERS